MVEVRVSRGPQSGFNDVPVGLPADGEPWVFDVPYSGDVVVCVRACLRACVNV